VSSLPGMQAAYHSATHFWRDS